MPHRKKGIRIMRSAVYSRLLNRNGSPPKCAVCNIEIKVDDKYVSKIGAGLSHARYAVYCVEHAREKNLIG